MTSSSKIRKKFDLCFTVRQDFFHSIINKVRQKEKNCPRKPPPKHSLICLVCSGSDCQSLDESGLNHMTRVSYTSNCAVTYEPSREKNCLWCFRPGPTQTRRYRNSRWLHACNYFVSGINNLRFIKFCF